MTLYVARDDFSTRKKLDQLSECYLIGRVSTDENDYPNIKVFDFQRFHNIFEVTPLCNEPYIISELMDNDQDYVGVDLHQSSGFLPVDYNSNIANDERLEMLSDLLIDKLIIFKPKINFSKARPDVGHKNLVIEKLVEIKSNDFSSYHIVPKINMDSNTFESKLKDNSYFVLNEYDNSLLNSPDLIYCDENLYLLGGDLEKHPNQVKMWKCNDFSKVKKIPMSYSNRDIDNKVIKVSENIIFISDEYLLELQTVSSSSKTMEKEVVKITEIEDIPTDTNTQITNEFDFLNAFDLYTRKQNLIYKKEDLVNLHTCIKSNVITIIAGMSGTGKTQLALSYAEMLDLDEENKNLLFLPISPSFTEPEDILGYYSNMHNKYVPASTGLVDLLVHAQNNVNKMHMVIFDEMNLSQIEFWFSPFISILERDPEDRFLTLYSANEDCVNKDIYPSKVKINENVIFIGTINIDDTTKEISDRLLDRSFIVSLSKQNFSLFKDEYSQIDSEDERQIEEFKCRNTAEFNNWRSFNPKQLKRSFSDIELNFFDEVHETISKIDNQKGISFRILKNISLYLMNVPCSVDGKPYFEREDSLDILFKQTVLNKIKGPENQLIDLLGYYDKDKKTFFNGELINTLNKYNSVSHFKLTREEIQRKMRDLSYYGYTR